MTLMQLYRRSNFGKSGSSGQVVDYPFDVFRKGRIKECFNYSGIYPPIHSNVMQLDQIQSSSKPAKPYHREDI